MRKKTKPEKNSIPEATGIGAILAAARTAKGIPFEQAAHETRISASRLREIESNDFSNLSHPTYARMFIADYARYLGVPVESIRDKLPEAGAFGGEGYQYLDALPVRNDGKTRTSSSRPRSGGNPVILAIAGLVALIVLLVIVLSIWMGLRNINRLTTHNSKPVPAAQVSYTATPAPADAIAPPSAAAPTPDLATLHKEDAGLLEASASDSPSAASNPRTSATALPSTSTSPQPSPSASP